MLGSDTSWRMAFKKRQKKGVGPVELITDEVLVCLREFMPLECSCCELILGFQHRTTGMIVCTPKCIGPHQHTSTLGTDPKIQPEEMFSTASRNMTMPKQAEDIVPDIVPDKFGAGDEGDDDAVLSVEVRSQHDAVPSTVSISTTALPPVEDMMQVAEKLESADEGDSTTLTAEMRSPKEKGSTESWNGTAPRQAEDMGHVAETSVAGGEEIDKFLAEASSARMDTKGCPVTDEFVYQLRTENRREEINAAHLSTSRISPQNETAHLPDEDDAFTGQAKASMVKCRYVFQEKPRSGKLLTQVSKKTRGDDSPAEHDVIDGPTIGLMNHPLFGFKKETDSPAVVPPLVSKKTITQHWPPEDNVIDGQANATRYGFENPAQLQAIVPRRVSKKTKTRRSPAKRDALNGPAKPAAVPLDGFKNAPPLPAGITQQLSKQSKPAYTSTEDNVLESSVEASHSNFKNAADLLKWIPPPLSKEAKTANWIAGLDAPAEKSFFKFTFNKKRDWTVGVNDNQVQVPVQTSVKSSMREVTPPSGTVIAKTVMERLHRTLHSAPEANDRMVRDKMVT